MFICFESVFVVECEMVKKVDEIKVRLVGSGVDVARILAYEFVLGCGE